MDMQVVDNNTLGAKIKVFGVGGGGGNAIQHMMKNGLEGVTFIAANTDVQALNGNPAEYKIQLGPDLTRGLGCGGNPEIGKASADESRNEINQYLEGADMVFITAGLGGGTGTGAAPVVAKLAQDKGILTVGVVTKPFSFEGTRKNIAQKALEELRNNVDCLIPIPNDILLTLAKSKSTGIGKTKVRASDALLMANDVLLAAVRGVTEIINKSGNINVDFADIKSVMTKGGIALMGEGSASGDDRAKEAAHKAINSPLLEDVNIAGAQAILITIRGDVDLLEMQDVVDYITSAAEQDNGTTPAIYVGLTDEDLEGEEIRVTVIATGIDPAGDGSGRKPLKPVEETIVREPGQPGIYRPRYQHQPQNAPLTEDMLDTPTYLRAQNYRPGAQDFQYAEDMTTPTFIRKQAN